MTHDSIKHLLRQELSNAGFTTEMEKNAGSEDKSRPGDVKVINWDEGKDLYIDCAIINPMTRRRKSSLITGGVGAAADNEEKRKRDKYAGKIDDKTSIFLPFIMETQGGFGKTAQSFMIEVEKRRNDGLAMSQKPAVLWQTLI